MAEREEAATLLFEADAAAAMRITYGTLLSLSDERAFDFVADPDNWPSFFDSVQSAEALEGWGAPGGKARVTARVMGQDVVSEFELLRWERPHRFGYVARTPGQPDLDNERVFEPVPGGTRLIGTTSAVRRSGPAGMWDVAQAIGLRRMYRTAMKKLPAQAMRTVRVEPAARALPRGDGGPTGTSAAGSLAQPLILPCGLVLPNRIVKAAMGEGLADPATSDATPALLRLHRRWAEGGAGTLVTGLMNVQRGSNDSTLMVIDEQTDTTALTRWAETVHERDARILAQLAHPGRQVPLYVSRRPVAPSSLPRVQGSHLFGRARALTAAEINELVDGFALAATILEAAGFDGVEIHAAHGYLIGQFLSPETNHRTDDWGGDLERRSRFLLEIVRRIRSRVGSGFAVAVKLNASDFRPGGFDVEDSAQVAGRLGEEGVDLIEISGGTYESRSGSQHVRSDEPGTSQDAYFAGFAPRLRELTSVPLALTGGLRSRAVMEELIHGHVVDLVGLGRPTVEQPGFPADLLAGRADRIVLSQPPTTSWFYELFWYMAQFDRLANGQDFDPGYSMRRLQRHMAAALLAQFAATARRQLSCEFHPRKGQASPPRS